MDNLDSAEEIAIRCCVTESSANELSQSASETEVIAKELLAIVCKNGGIVNVNDDALGSLSQVGTEFLKEKGFYPLLQSSLRGVLTLEYDRPTNQATLRVKANQIELCKAYTSNTGCSLDDECPRLHVCPHFVKGNCASGVNQNCSFNHNFEQSHEQGILSELKLDSLHEGSLLPLLRNIVLGVSDGILSNVEVCPQYNAVRGCPTGDSCMNLHLCTAFSKGECGNGAADCTRSHDVLDEKIRLAKSFRRYEEQMMASRRINFQNLVNLARSVALTRAGPPTIDEICSFHLKGNCSYGRLCKKYWNNLAYLWQISVTLEDDSEKWVNFPSLYNQLIEWDYCDVTKDTSVEINFGGGQNASLHVCLDEMVAKTQTDNNSVKIRRLSTASWVKASPNDSFCTRWTWYWKNSQDQWVPYDENNNDGANTQINVSAVAQNSCGHEILEENYLSVKYCLIAVSLGTTCLGARSFTLFLDGQTYNIDLQNFQQTNAATGMSTKIRRRPKRFIGTREVSTVLQLRGRHCETPSSPSRQAPPAVNNIPLPQGWTATSAGQDVVMVTLQPGSAEYNHVQTEFKKTLGSKTIHKIERVENIDLWESYSRKLSKLTRKLGRPAEVRKLFHGTNENAVKSICQQGFDWRLNGPHGTVYGRGTYFAVNASLSNSYTTLSSSTSQKMFLNKVIVGLYTVGNSGMVRPPPINTSKPYELYHSCVDNQANPTQFVVFENDQAYPEFVITYS